MNLAINGFGRIGRMALRALYQHPGYHQQQLRITAINTLAHAADCAHLLQYDSTHGRFDQTVTYDDTHLIINDQPIALTAHRDPSQLSWSDQNIDVVLECTGQYTQRQQAQAHLAAGAAKVLISAPGEGVDATVVFGVNHTSLQSSDAIISCASCTTNCLAQVVAPLHQALHIQSGLMNTIHAYTSDQNLLDNRHRDRRRARAANLSMIPTKTGAARSIGLIIPELAGKIDGLAVRVPTPNVSLVDLTFVSEQSASCDEIHQILQAAAAQHQQTVLTLSDQPLVSVDFNQHPASAIVDTTQTRTMGSLTKVLAWYDNEWAFAHRMLDTALFWSQLT